MATETEEIESKIATTTDAIKTLKEVVAGHKTTLDNTSPSDQKFAEVLSTFLSTSQSLRKEQTKLSELYVNLNALLLVQSQEKEDRIIQLQKQKVHARRPPGPETPLAKKRKVDQQNDLDNNDIVQTNSNNNNSNSQDEPTGDIYEAKREDFDLGEYTSEVKKKVLINNLTNKLKAAHTYRPTGKDKTFSGEEDAGIRSIRFLVQIQNWYNSNKQTVGYEEAQALQSLKESAFTGLALNKVNQQRPQEIRTFEEFFKWFNENWSMESSAEAISKQLRQVQIRDNVTPVEMINDIDQLLSLYNICIIRCSPNTVAATELTDTQLIQNITSAMPSKWM